jgi:hypothetical protein
MLRLRLVLQHLQDVHALVDVEVFDVEVDAGVPVLRLRARACCLLHGNLLQVFWLISVGGFLVHLRFLLLDRLGWRPLVVVTVGLPLLGRLRRGVLAGGRRRLLFRAIDRLLLSCISIHFVQSDPSIPIFLTVLLRFSTNSRVLISF